MKTNLLAGLVLGGAVVTTLAVTPEVNALTMNGSIPFGALSATANTGNLATATIIKPFVFLANEVVVNPGAGVGDFLAAPGAIVIPATDINLTTQTFSFADASFGSWTTTSIGNVTYVPATFNLTFNIFGTFAPGAIYPGFSAGPAQIAVSLTQVGGAGQAISWSATLVSPPQTTVIPEPMTAGLGLLSLGALGAFATRRRQA